MQLTRNKWGILGVSIGVVLVILASVLYILNQNSRKEPIEWELTLVGKNQQHRVLSYNEIRAMPSHKARGGFFTTVGVVNGPYEVIGVLVTDLCALVGGITSQDVVMTSAVDGYSMVFDYDQLSGNIPTYDPKTIHEVPHDELQVLLIYEQDGKPLSHDSGKPLRIAVVGNADLLTEGHWWVKWINKLEVISLK
jgi:DMSO/TMAO reductase YedYZ molybdopterin-dependent catalytic subunit